MVTSTCISIAETSSYMSLHIPVQYIYICVCVCVCVCSDIHIRHWNSSFAGRIFPIQAILIPEYLFPFLTSFSDAVLSSLLPKLISSQYVILWSIFVVHLTVPTCSEWNLRIITAQRQPEKEITRIRVFLPSQTNFGLLKNIFLL
jgi:hypothetical protein